MSSKLPILIVSYNQRNLQLLAEFLRKEGYDVLSAARLQDFKQILDSEKRFGLALVDIAGFDRTIWEYCVRLTDHGVPFLIISPQNLYGAGQEGLSHGARGVIVKPLVIKELMKMVGAMLLEDTHE